jgi:hypothetical protein
VQIGRRDETYEYSAVPGSPSGIVIGIDSQECDNYERVESVKIRWQDGRIETLEPEGEDLGGDWELVDTTPLLYANLYLYDRAYGGSEEGGWWYDTYTPADGDWNTEPPKHGLCASVDVAEAAYAITLGSAIDRMAHDLTYPPTSPPPPRKQ